MAQADGSSGSDAGSRPQRKGMQVRRGVRLCLREVQYLVLRVWFTLIGPPRVLSHHYETNARLLRAFGARVGTDVRVLSPVTIHMLTHSYRNLTIGDRCIVNGNNFIDLSETVTLEAGASLGPGVVIMTHNRFNRNAFLEKRLSRMCGRKPVVIGAGAGIKANALILHGVTVGSEAVVAGASVVIKDVPARHFVSGAPAVTRTVLE
jgi:acetyltransferase-like isoleucine patch superfamily enzyme